MVKTTREARKQARQRHKRNRAIAFAAIVVGVLGLAVYLLGQAFSRPGLSPVAGNVIDVQADMGGFNMKEIRVRAGEPVTVRLTSLDSQYHTDGGGKHQWAVDELRVSIVAPPKGSNEATFTPDQPGVYTYYCDICCGGRANPSMQGRLVVEG
ncbi:MAG: cupredoxin domain-containing protein [Chloroflexota bacterium]